MTRDAGSFTNVPPGDYFIRFGAFGQTTSTRHDIHSVVVGGDPRSSQSRYTYAPVTILPLEPVTFSYVGLFCDNSDPDSGILSMSLSATGTPIGFIRYDVWEADANPETDMPIRTYTTTDLSEMTHTFTDLTEGEYIARVTTECGFNQQEVSLIIGATTMPDPTVPDAVCADEEFTVAIPLPETLFDITWKDEDGNVLGTGNTITLSQTETTTYTVSYVLNASLGCPDAVEEEKTFTVEVDCGCTEPGASGTPLTSSVGILTKGNPTVANWPMSVPNGYLVLDSKEKGMVITQMTTTQIDALTPTQGMVVYDTDLGCVKLYRGLTPGTDESRTGWNCIEEGCNE